MGVAKKFLKIGRGESVFFKWVLLYTLLRVSGEGWGIILA